MSDSHDDGNDPVLEAAGQRLRHRSPTVAPEAVEVVALRRRNRRTRLVAGASMAVAVVLGVTVVARGSSSTRQYAAQSLHTAEVDRIVASLDAKPVDPTRVKLVSTVSSFPDCNALIGDLRRVGAQHVGSRGFGDYNYGVMPMARESFDAVGAPTASVNGAASSSKAAADQVGGGETLGTNVQVAGVDELDYVKAEGKYIYDLDGKGNLRVTDSSTLQVVGTVDVTPGTANSSDSGDTGDFAPTPNDEPSVSQILVSKGRVAVFGSEYETSKPVEGDPSATQISTSYMTVAFVDATDPAKPKVTDRVRVEGSLVSARLVDGEIRLVTTSHMADLGFVVPTTPNSVAKALDMNRRSVAASTAADWIPDWQRSGEKPQPLVPCDRVNVPDTFSGVAMTSMVTFPIGSGRFEPEGTAILAPGDTLYAGLDKVAISSEVWVDPIDRDRLKFDDWQTAIHEFTFRKGEAPSYIGSGIVDGSTVGQFAFGEIGKSLAVVTTKGTPWAQDTSVGIDMTVFTADGKGHLNVTAKVADLSDGKGAVTAVRFVPDRVLISAGRGGHTVYVLDVSDPAKPRRAGSVALDGDVGYFHPLPEHQALVVGSRSDSVGSGNNQRYRPWVQVQLLDVANADAPRIVNTWERPWSSDQVGSDHHAFTYWPERKLAMWGVQDASQDYNYTDVPNHAVVLGVGGNVTETAVPVANKPPEVAAPCAVVDVTSAQAAQMLGSDAVVLRCAPDAPKELEWPRYLCSYVSPATVDDYAPGASGEGRYFICNPAPQPSVSRVLVVSGRPILMTDQTLEALDPSSFSSTAVVFHPTNSYFARSYIVD